MIKKKAAQAYVIAGEYLKKGNLRAAAMAFDVGAKLEKIAVGTVTNKWYVNIDEEEVGPITLDVMAKLIISRVIDNESLVWNSEMGDWLPAGEAPNVKDLFGKIYDHNANADDGALSNTYLNMRDQLPVPRRERLHPAVEFGADDVDSINRNNDLISQYIQRAHDKLSQIDQNIFPVSKNTSKPSSDEAKGQAVQHLRDLENFQAAFKKVIDTGRGRKGHKANIALDHLRSVIEEDIAKGNLDKDEESLLKAYLEYLQPNTGKPGQPDQFKAPPRQKV